MFGTNLRYYRLKKRMTAKALAEKCSLTPMAISNYEEGKRMPEMDIIRKLADALDVRVMDFLAVRNENLVFEHGVFHEHLPKAQQEYILAAIEEYFSRFYTAVDLSGPSLQNCFPDCHALHFKDDVNEDSKALRKHLSIHRYGPVNDLLAWLEREGIQIFLCDIDDSKFTGMHGIVNRSPYIAVNGNMNTADIRMTVTEQLVYMMFDCSDNMSEKQVKDIASAFLLPEYDLEIELGLYRKRVSRDMLALCRRYGVSLDTLLNRAQRCHILPAKAVKDFRKQAKLYGWNTDVSCNPDKPLLFEQMVYRMVSDGEISIQKGAELVKRSYSEVSSACIFGK